MELFQRVEMILSLYKMPKYELAKKIGASQPTLSRYFTLDQQDRLKMYLWEIADIFPEINRDWLFFEKGQMLQADEEKSKNDEIKKLKAEISRLKTERLVEGTASQDSAENTGNAADGAA